VIFGGFACVRVGRRNGVRAFALRPVLLRTGAERQSGERRPCQLSHKSLNWLRTPFDSVHDCVIRLTQNAPAAIPCVEDYRPQQSGERENRCRTGLRAEPRWALASRWAPPPAPRPRK